MCLLFVGTLLLWFTYDKDVVQLVHAINLWQQLIDHRVMNPCVTSLHNNKKCSFLKSNTQKFKQINRK